MKTKYYSDAKIRNGIWETNINEIKFTVEKERINTYFFNLMNSKTYKVSKNIANHIPEISKENLLSFLNNKLKYFESEFYIETAKINNIYNIEQINKLRKFIKKIKETN